MATALASLLPKPSYAPTVSDDEDEIVQVPAVAPSQSVVIRAAVPPYGQRRGWKPTSPDDFGELPNGCHPPLTYPLKGDGGSYPECHVAQYPLGMGKKKVRLVHCSCDVTIIKPTSGFLWQHTRPSSRR